MSINSWTGVGNLTREPELTYTQTNNTAKCTFTLAVNRPRRNGEEQGADYVRIVTWNRQAETCGRYLHKGSQCAVRGEIRTGSYKNKDGVTVYTCDVWAQNVEFLGGGRNSENDEPRSESRERRYVDPREYDLPDTFSSAEDDIPF